MHRQVIDRCTPLNALDILTLIDESDARYGALFTLVSMFLSLLLAYSSIKSQQSCTHQTKKRRNDVLQYGPTPNQPAITCTHQTKNTERKPTTAMPPRRRNAPKIISGNQNPGPWRESESLFLSLVLFKDTWVRRLSMSWVELEDDAEV